MAETKVISKTTELKETLTDIVKSWESLEGNKSYKPKEIENWLITQMKPSIDKARTLLGNFTNEEITEPVENIILNFKCTYKPIMSNDGVYYHYADVCKMLNDIKKQK